MSKLEEMHECFKSLEIMKDNLIARGINLDGNSLGPLYRRLTTHLIGETSSNARGLTDQGTSIKIRSEKVGIKDANNIVDDMDLDNEALNAVVVVVVNSIGTCQGIFRATKEEILEQGARKTTAKYIVTLPKFVGYAQRLL